VDGGLAAVTVLQVGVAESFQGAGFFCGRAEVAGDGQRLSVTLAGLAGGRGPGGELTEVVQRLSLAELVAKVSVKRQGLLVVDGGGRVVSGLLLYDAQVVEGVGLAE
jgi:hypothetical protein